MSGEEGIGPQWFGPEAWNQYCAEVRRVPVPTGKSCRWCEEGFEAGDRGFGIPQIGVDLEPIAYFHLACLIRTIVGSVGHQTKQCECYGGEDHSEDGISCRTAANRAWMYFHASRESVN